jgi:hypothetical protein
MEGAPPVEMKELDMAVFHNFGVDTWNLCSSFACIVSEKRVIQ